MSEKSTAKFVSYDLRPAKQTERKILLDSFGAAMEAGFPISDYRYVGMGGNRFYDFVLIHKFLGIEKMISLEYDRKMFPRAVYNSPYQFIDVRYQDVQQFLSGDRWEGNSIYWMDYDKTLRPNIVRDVATLAPHARFGDFVFFTVCAVPPRRLQRFSSADRLIEIRDMFGDLGLGVTREDVEDANFSTAVQKVLQAAFSNAFVIERGAEFKPYFKVGYADGLEMLTYGGVFAEKERVRYFNELLKSKVPILTRTRQKRYQIKKFNLTERERSLFDRAATAGTSNAQERKDLFRIGFRAREITQYRELLRYHPRYVETLL